MMSFSRWAGPVGAAVAKVDSAMQTITRRAWRGFMMARDASGALRGIDEAHAGGRMRLTGFPGEAVASCRRPARAAWRREAARGGALASRDRREGPGSRR